VIHGSFRCPIEKKGKSARGGKTRDRHKPAIFVPPREGGKKKEKGKGHTQTALAPLPLTSISVGRTALERGGAPSIEKGEKERRAEEQNPLRFSSVCDEEGEKEKKRGGEKITTVSIVPPPVSIPLKMRGKEKRGSRGKERRREEEDG